MDTPLLRRYCYRTSALFGEINWGHSYLRRSEKLTCHCGVLRARACQDRRRTPSAPKLLIFPHGTGVRAPGAARASSVPVTKPVWKQHTRPARGELQNTCTPRRVDLGLFLSFESSAY
ncbi:hypothetical protein TNCT_568411 [Trichonephila clavata]|uniref:Uncharacterized protein n=1 Tax=Trichonephila clavata TaxID=2740835 RepID=A0A8X6GG98_TRICU|nr:hypothetical protein TNCT_568411 [Trichonephila clavata]